MDPNAALTQMHHDALDGAFIDAWGAARGLREWLERGGFAPRDMSRQNALTVCEMVEQLCDQLVDKDVQLKGAWEALKRSI